MDTQIILTIQQLIWLIDHIIPNEINFNYFLKCKETCVSRKYMASTLHKVRNKHNPTQYAAYYIDCDIAAQTSLMETIRDFLETKGSKYIDKPSREVNVLCSIQGMPIRFNPHEQPIVMELMQLSENSFLSLIGCVGQMNKIPSYVVK